MRVGLEGAWTVSDDVCDGLDAPRGVLGAVPGLASLPENGSSTNRKIKLIGTNAVLIQRCWHARVGLEGAWTVSDDVCDGMRVGLAGAWAVSDDA